MMAVLIFITGMLISLIGMLMMVSTALPSFGGSRGNEAAVFFSGLATFLVGTALIFYAGTWAA